MKIVYLGSGEFGIECLNTLGRSSHNLRFIVTQPPQPAGRGRKPKPTPVAHWANMHSVPFVETDDANTPKLIETIAHYEPDLIVVIAFGQKIGNELINLPSKGAINVHASLLPKYRGAAPINWAIINGETETGISVITLAEKMDTGNIIAQSQIYIGPDETAGQLHDRRQIYQLIAGSPAEIVRNEMIRKLYLGNTFAGDEFDDNEHQGTSFYGNQK